MTAPRSNPLDRPDWQLPPGVPRPLWEYVHDKQIAVDDARFLAGESLLAIDQRLVLEVAESLTARGAQRCIDLGCGTGRLSRTLVDRGWSVVGVDLSQPSLTVARSGPDAPSHGRLALLRANLCELEAVAGPPFDLALLMFGTLGMISGHVHRRAVLDSAARLLAPGGTLLFHVHNWWRHLDHPTGRRWLVRDIGRVLKRRDDAGDTSHDYRGIPGVYHHVFRRSEWQRLLRKSGFVITREWPLAFPESPSGDFLQGPSFWTALRCTGWIVAATRS